MNFKRKANIMDYAHKRIEHVPDWVESTCVIIYRRGRLYFVSLSERERRWCAWRRWFRRRPFASALVMSSLMIFIGIFNAMLLAQMLVLAPSERLIVSTFVVSVLFGVVIGWAFMGGRNRE